MRVSAPIAVCVRTVQPKAAAAPKDLPAGFVEHLVGRTKPRPARNETIASSVGSHQSWQALLGGNTGLDRIAHVLRIDEIAEHTYTPTVVVGLVTGRDDPAAPAVLKAVRQGRQNRRYIVMNEKGPQFLLKPFS